MFLNLGHVNKTLACDLTLAGKKTQIRTPKNSFIYFFVYKKTFTISQSATEQS